jgi:DNA adenine methylase
MKSPLRYPGGKTRAVKTILEFIPEDCGELCSPFLGGGSVELALAEKGTKVYGYDSFEPLVWFWKALLNKPAELARAANSFRKDSNDFELNNVKVKGLLREDFDEIRKNLKEETKFSILNAARFYAINRSSFSGATFSGGWSRRAAYARFTDSSIKRVKDFKEPNIVVECKDFKESIPLHPDAFLYLDPPYMLASEEQERLYGKSGDKHKGFDHKGLYNILKERDNWLLSYSGDGKAILDMYSDFVTYDVTGAWTYGMKNITPPKHSYNNIMMNLMKKYEELFLDRRHQDLYHKHMKEMKEENKELRKDMSESSEILIMPQSVYEKHLTRRKYV